MMARERPPGMETDVLQKRGSHISCKQQVRSINSTLVGAYDGAGGAHGSDCNRLCDDHSGVRGDSSWLSRAAGVRSTPTACTVVSPSSQSTTAAAAVSLPTTSIRARTRCIRPYHDVHVLISIMLLSVLFAHGVATATTHLSASVPVQHPMLASEHMRAVRTDEGPPASAALMELITHLHARARVTSRIRIQDEDHSASSTQSLLNSQVILQAAPCPHSIHPCDVTRFNHG